MKTYTPMIKTLSTKSKLSWSLDQKQHPILSRPCLCMSSKNLKQSVDFETKSTQSSSQIKISLWTTSKKCLILTASSTRSQECFQQQLAFLKNKSSVALILVMFSQKKEFAFNLIGFLSCMILKPLKIRTNLDRKDGNNRRLKSTAS